MIGEKYTAQSILHVLLITLIFNNQSTIGRSFAKHHENTCSIIHGGRVIQNQSLQQYTKLAYIVQAHNTAIHWF
jgi:hypothetical protein